MGKTEGGGRIKQIKWFYYRKQKIKQHLNKIIKSSINYQYKYSMDLEGLFKVQDVNSIIKLFAFSIQQRFQQIDGVPKSNSDSNNHYLSGQSFQDSQHLIRKYRNYMSSDQRQIKYLEKLVSRIMQILDFFKQRSKNQQILTVAVKRIDQKLNKIVNSVPIDVQWLYSYILDLAKNGFATRRTPLRDRRYSVKKIDVSDRKTTQQNSQIKKENSNDELEQIKLIPAINNITKQRRAVSLSAKRVAKPQVPKQPIQLQISKLYCLFDLDCSHMQKITQTKDRSKTQKECMKQNSGIANAILNYQRSYNFYLKKKEKQKSDTTLKQVNNRSSVRPVVNNWISRKRKITECRKRMIDCQNSSLL